MFSRQRISVKHPQNDDLTARFSDHYVAIGSKLFDSSTGKEFHWKATETARFALVDGKITNGYPFKPQTMDPDRVVFSTRGSCD